MSAGRVNSIRRLSARRGSNELGLELEEAANALVATDTESFSQFLRLDETHPDEMQRVLSSSGKMSGSSENLNLSGSGGSGLGLEHPFVTSTVLSMSTASDGEDSSGAAAAATLQQEISGRIQQSRQMVNDTTALLLSPTTTQGEKQAAATALKEQFKVQCEDVVFTRAVLVSEVERHNKTKERVTTVQKVLDETIMQATGLQSKLETTQAALIHARYDNRGDGVGCASPVLRRRNQSPSSSLSHLEKEDSLGKKETALDDNGHPLPNTVMGLQNELLKCQRQIRELKKASPALTITTDSSSGDQTLGTSATHSDPSSGTFSKWKTTSTSNSGGFSPSGSSPKPTGLPIGGSGSGSTTAVNTSDEPMSLREELEKAQLKSQEQTVQINRLLGIIEQMQEAQRSNGVYSNSASSFVHTGDDEDDDDEMSLEGCDELAKASFEASPTPQSLPIPHPPEHSGEGGLGDPLEGHSRPGNSRPRHILGGVEKSAGTAAPPLFHTSGDSASGVENVVSPLITVQSGTHIFTDTSSMELPPPPPQAHGEGEMTSLFDIH